MLGQPADLRSRREYPFDVERAAATLEVVNSSKMFLAGDRLVSQHFGTIAESLAPRSVAENVVLLDAVWRTKVSMERGALDHIATSLEERAGHLIGLLEALSPDALEMQPEAVYRAAQQALPVVLFPTSAPLGTLRQNYSLATKFFHWATRQHFPIVDSRARKSVNALQRAVKASPLVRADTAEMGGVSYVDEYERWVRFYSDLIAGLDGVDRERLLRADYDSQLGCHSPLRNTLLRALDKVFWAHGGGVG